MHDTRAWIGVAADCAIVVMVWLRVIPWWVVAVIVTLDALIISLGRFRRAAGGRHALEATGRWMLFTDDELRLLAGYVYTGRLNLRLAEEARAELNRRDHPRESA